MSSEETTTEERTLYAAYEAADEFAKRCRAVAALENWSKQGALDRAMNDLMTCLWDELFSQTEIRKAFEAALSDMNRYAAGEERR